MQVLIGSILTMDGFHHISIKKIAKIVLKIRTYRALTGLAIRDRVLNSTLQEQRGHLTPGNTLNSLGVISFLHLEHMYFVIKSPFYFLFLIFSLLAKELSSHYS